MIKKTNAKKQSIAVEVMEFLKKYIVFILLLLIGYPYLKRLLDREKIKNEQSNATVIKEIKLLENTSPILQGTKRDKITRSQELQAASAKLAHDFGYDVRDQGNWFDFLNPRGMTENDAEIRNTLMKYRNYFPILEKLYFEVDTNSRKLRSDILQYLDKDMLIQVRKVIKI
jgi:hypothetical protein